MIITLPNVQCVVHVLAGMLVLQYNFILSLISCMCPLVICMYNQMLADPGKCTDHIFTYMWVSVISTMWTYIHSAHFKSQ